MPKELQTFLRVTDRFEKNFYYNPMPPGKRDLILKRRHATHLQPQVVISVPPAVQPDHH
jgi:hypothetical protein